ncbi:MAG TPA: ATP-binding cassette domain-containing protein, partial [Leifsonia sp.]|nr:ATP-binding cassette domain-containing protein [Leifsonia sp.]
SYAADQTTPTNDAVLIHLSGIGKVFLTDEVETHALDDIRLDIRQGEYVAIEGPSGCENVELPLTYRGMSIGERKKRVTEALDRVGMSHRMQHYPAQLSGGQQQRVAVARAVAGDPLILLADEPTGNLDSANGESVMELLRELHRNGATICMVTHDPRYAAHAERSVHLFDGHVVERVEAVG